MTWLTDLSVDVMCHVTFNLWLYCPSTCVTLRVSVHCLQVSRDVDAREKELTHQVHREMLIRCLEQVKTLAPILICSMKIFIQISSHPNSKATQCPTVQYCCSSVRYVTGQ